MYFKLSPSLKLTSTCCLNFFAAVYFPHENAQYSEPDLLGCFFVIYTPSAVADTLT